MISTQEILFIAYFQSHLTISIWASAFSFIRILSTQDFSTLCNLKRSWEAKFWALGLIIFSVVFQHRYMPRLTSLSFSQAIIHKTSTQGIISFFRASEVDFSVESWLAQLRWETRILSIFSLKDNIHFSMLEEAIKTLKKFGSWFQARIYYYRIAIQYCSIWFSRETSLKNLYQHMLIIPNICTSKRHRRFVVANLDSEGGWDWSKGLKNFEYRKMMLQTAIWAFSIEVVNSCPDVLRCKWWISRNHGQYKTNKGKKGCQEERFPRILC